MAGIMAGAALFGGMGLIPNNSVANQHQAINIPGSYQINRTRKRTPLGTEVPRPGKHQFALVPQKHKKHTNRKHLKAAARRKSIRKGK